ncbi:MAG: YsnF/AvaK domain-containing protein [Ktedonobacteraceae bacterium]
MAIQTAIIAGVFEKESDARRALDALKQAGFGYDQVGVAPQGQSDVNLLHDLTDLGVTRDTASYYDQEYKNGRTVVSVRPDGRDQEAHDILHRYKGYDFEHQTDYNQQSSGYAADQAATTDRANYATTNDVVDARTNGDYAQDEFHQPRSLRLREEQLNVSKERVQAGEVGLHKEIIAEQKTVNVPVTHEEVVIERHAVTDGRVDNTPIGEGETIRVPVSEEQVSVSKNTVVTGEVAVGKRAVEETQQVTDTVRREEARIDQQGNAIIHGSQNDNLHGGTTNVDDTANRGNL